MISELQCLKSSWVSHQTIIMPFPDYRDLSQTKDILPEDYCNPAAEDLRNHNGNKIWEACGSYYPIHHSRGPNAGICFWQTVWQSTSGAKTQYLYIWGKFQNQYAQQFQTACTVWARLALFFLSERKAQWFPAGAPRVEEVTCNPVFLCKDGKQHDCFCAHAKTHTLLQRPLA